MLSRDHHKTFSIWSEPALWGWSFRTGSKLFIHACMDVEWERSLLGLHRLLFCALFINSLGMILPCAYANFMCFFNRYSYGKREKGINPPDPQELRMTSLWSRGPINSLSDLRRHATNTLFSSLPGEDRSQNPSHSRAPRLSGARRDKHRMWTRRTRPQIMSDILRFTLRPRLKTHIMEHVSLSFLQLEKYLDALNHKGFLEKLDGRYLTTEKGRYVIEACDLCLQLCREEP